MQLSSIIEALIFASPSGISSEGLVKSIQTTAKEHLAELAEQAEELEGHAMKEELAERELWWEPFTQVTEDAVHKAINELCDLYDQHERAFTLAERATGWRVVTRSEWADWLRALFPSKRAERLSAPALETLAIIAYRQPITKAGIEQIRGVAVDGVMQKLLDRSLVHILGRAELPGRPLLYETTELFLDYFGIPNLDSLPDNEELRRPGLPGREKPVKESEDEVAATEGPESKPSDTESQATSPQGLEANAEKNTP